MLVNLPIILGLSSLPQTGLIPYFAQILNQTYNAGMNYNNRNATVDTTSKDLLRGYTLAISSSLLVMYSCRRMLHRFNIDISKGRGFYMALGVNLVGTACASAINCLSMRWKELEGVTV